MLIPLERERMTMERGRAKKKSSWLRMSFVICCVSLSIWGCWRWSSVRVIVALSSSTTEISPFIISLLPLLLLPTHSINISRLHLILTFRSILFSFGAAHFWRFHLICRRRSEPPARLLPLCSHHRRQRYSRSFRHRRHEGWSNPDELCALRFGQL